VAFWGPADATAGGAGWQDAVRSPQEAGEGRWRQIDDAPRATPIAADARGVLRGGDPNGLKRHPNLPSFNPRDGGPVHYGGGVMHADGGATRFLICGRRRHGALRTEAIGRYCAHSRTPFALTEASHRQIEAEAHSTTGPVHHG